ncbi:MAG: hypothetical protein ACWGQW_18610, partial [bacterium]
RAVLSDPPSSQWFCSIAVTGQKHTVIWAKTNRGQTYTVRFESVNVHTNSAVFSKLLANAQKLYDLGVSKSGIVSGCPRPSHIAEIGKHEYLEYASHLRPYLCSPLLELVVFTLAKRNSDGIKSTLK